MTENTIALVTGANKGIGQQVARQLAALGMTVLLTARDPDRLAEAVAGVREDHPDVHPLLLDVTDPASARAAAKEVEERHGKLDVLVNNAGIHGDLTGQTPGSADLAAVREVFETNVFGVLTVTEAMVPLLLRSPAPRIVNVTSSLGSLTGMTTPGSYLASLPPFAGYAPSKTALNALTVQYAKALRDRNVLVNLADPGACATDFTRDVGRPIPRTAADGAAVAVRLATLGTDGPTGGCFNEAGELPW